MVPRYYQELKQYYKNKPEKYTALCQSFKFMEEKVINKFMVFYQIHTEKKYNHKKFLEIQKMVHNMSVAQLHDCFESGIYNWAV